MVMKVMRVRFFLFLSIIKIQAIDRDLLIAYKNPRVRAFLDMIAFAEGTDHDLGYRTLFTGALFHHYHDHPRKKICGCLKGKMICSTAAGRYQILARTWDHIRPKIEAIDFSPRFQDFAALALMQQYDALTDIISGKIGKAVKKLNKVWASFVGSPYGQPTKSWADLKKVFLDRLQAHKQYRSYRQGVTC